MQPCYWAIAKLPGLSKQERELLGKNALETTKDLLIIRISPSTQPTPSTTSPVSYSVSEGS